MEKFYVRKVMHQFVITAILVFSAGAASSNDLDDGIALDDRINDDLKTTVNIPFILMKAKGAELRSKEGIESSRPVITQGQNGQGNIIIGAGTKLRPGTTIINSSQIKNSNSISR